MVRRDRRGRLVGLRAAREGLGGRGRGLGSPRDAVPGVRPGRRNPGHDLGRNRASHRTATSQSCPPRTCPRVRPSDCSKSRAEFLAELVSLQDSIVVSGAHGKTTTTGMIAFALERLGRDPSFLIGGEIPQLGGNAARRLGLARRRGRRVRPDGGALRPQIAVVTNVDLDHHSEFASRAEVEELFERWLAEVPHVVRAEELEPVDFELAIPGEHNRRNAAAALAALELAGLAAGGGADRISPSSPVRAGASSSAARPGACACSTTTRTTPRRSRGDRGGARRASRPRPVPAAPLLAHAPPRAGNRRRARLRRTSPP